MPTLKAAMLAPDARVGACSAYAMIRICSPGTVAKPKRPMSTSDTTVSGLRGGGQREEREHHGSAPPSTTARVVGTERSAARPP